MHTCPVARIWPVAAALALLWCTGARAQTPQGQHEIGHIVAESPESILGTSMDKNSTYYVWAFNPVSEETSVLFSATQPPGSGHVVLYPGSTRDLMIWSPLDPPSSRTLQHFALAAGGGEPIDLEKHFGDHATQGWFHASTSGIYTNGILPKKGLLLLESHQGSEWYIGSRPLTDSLTEKYLLFDARNRKVIGEAERDPLLRSLVPLFCSLGEQGNLYLTVSDGSSDYGLVLFALDPFRLLGEIDLPGWPHALQPGASKNEAILVCSSETGLEYYRVTCRETGGPDAIKMKAFDHLDIDPENVGLVGWRDGAKIWGTKNPRELHLQPEQGEEITHPMDLEGCKISRDDSYSALVAYQPAQFRVWTIGPSEVTLAGIFRVFDSTGPQPIEIRPIEPSEEFPQPEETPAEPE